MNDKDKRFLEDIKYFREENWDIESYCDFNLERLMKLKPKIALQYATYKMNKEILNIFINQL